MEALYYHGVKRTKVCSLHETFWIGEYLRDGSVSSSLCLSSYQGKVNILENEWIHCRDLTVLRSSQGHFCAWNVYNEAECFHSLHDPVFKSLSSAIKVAIFGKPLLVYLETLRQVAKIDHAQGQIQCSITCTLVPCQNLFRSSYFLSSRWTAKQYVFLHIQVPTRKQSNKRSGMRMKTESETGESLSSRQFLC